MKYDQRRLRYHPPSEEQRQTYEAINDAFCQLMSQLIPLLPDSADSTVAARHIELSRMYCNAAVALENEPLR